MDAMLRDYTFSGWAPYTKENAAALLSRVAPGVSLPRIGRKVYVSRPIPGPTLVMEKTGAKTFLVGVYTHK